MSGPISWEKSGEIAVITVDNPPVNALSAGVRDGLLAAVTEAGADAGVKAMIIVGAKRTFIAGADIREFGKPRTGAPLLDVNDRIEFSDKPVVAAIHGTALGGGLEVALCCHYRYAVPSAQVGLPEVKLGLIPGAGGTQRLPRLVGVEKALGLITSGDFLRAGAAKELGIVDEVGEDLVEGAIAYAERLVAEGAPAKRIRDLPCNADAAVFETFRKAIARRSRGFKAPWACIDAVEAATRGDFEAGYAEEQRLFKEVHDSPESAAQRHVFFAEREVAKIPDVPRETPVKDVRRAAVIGAGTMGGGIAMNFANAGIPVVILELDQAALDRGLAIVRGNYQATVDKGRLAQARMDERMALISTTTVYADIADVDIVIEAVFEEMEIKKQIFAKLSEVVNRDAVLASNTSTLDIDQMADATDRPGQVIGMHFFSPANVMRLLEVVRGGASTPETIATAMAVGRRLGKISVLVGNCHGFVGNRMLHGYSRQAGFLLEEGAMPEQVDKVIYDFGLPMGPFTMGDMAGLDVGWRIRKATAHLRPSNMRYSTIADQICELGRFGQKTQAGWYRYEDGSRAPVPDPIVAEIIEKASAEQGIERRDIPDQEVLERCIYQLVNIGAQLLDEGMALRALDIDVIYIAGYGFPAYRGGPMFWADSVGLDKVLATIRRFHEEVGEEWRPAPLLERLVAEGKSFADFGK